MKPNGTGPLDYDTYQNQHSKKYHYLAKIDIHSEKYKYMLQTAEGGACAAGATSFRNKWITPMLKQFMYAQDIVSSNQINFYTAYQDSTGPKRITSPEMLAPLLKAGDVLIFEPNTAVFPNATIWHTATVLENDPNNKTITYIEYHMADPAESDKPLVQIWKSTYEELNHFPDERLYGGGSWKDQSEK